MHPTPTVKIIVPAPPDVKRIWVSTVTHAKASIHGWRETISPEAPG